MELPKWLIKKEEEEEKRKNFQKSFRKYNLKTMKDSKRVRKTEKK